MRRGILILLILIVALGAFLRFYLIKEIPLGLYPDEAMNGNNALEVLATGNFKVFYPENNGREGLFINLQAASLKIFGNEPWALRAVSAVFGTLTILGIYLLTKELFRKETMALLAAFFLATSYWHVNFSRIGFRAILLPLLSTLSLYFLLKGLRTEKIMSIVWTGIFTGLGFYSYIGFRFMPFVLLIPLGWYFFQWRKKQYDYCFPCLTAMFLLIVLATTLPLALYFFQNPQDFIGRSGQVSIFSSASPAKEFIKSNLLTLGMFFVQGDCNWRHNFACRPGLNLFVAVFFVIGLVLSIRYVKHSVANITLLGWFAFMTLPATLTREGLPHALRSIGLIPPVMIFSGVGSYWLGQKILGWFEKQKVKRPKYIGQIERIEKELGLLFVLILLLIPLATYRDYFLRWADNPNTYFAFSADLLNLGRFLDKLPQDIKKYVVVNLSGVDVRGVPTPAQTVMFVTDTFREEERIKKNTYYLVPPFLDQNLIVRPSEKTIIVFMDGMNRETISTFRQKFPQLKIYAPWDFTIMQNY